MKDMEIDDGDRFELASRLRVAKGIIDKLRERIGVGHNHWNELTEASGQLAESLDLLE